MTAARVHRLRLRASHDDDVRRGAILVGDALRVATLPEARSARHYVVRRLDLGRFARDAAPQTIALAIEQRLAPLVRLAVPAGAPGAVAAPAVWFPDEATAIAALAARVIAGPPPAEWFWRRIAGGAVARASAGEILAGCLAAAADSAAGPLAVALVVDRVERARPGALLGSWTATQAEALIARTFGARAPRTAAPASDGISAIERLAPAWRARLSTWLPRWPEDARGVCLVALALVSCGAAPASPDRLLARARALAVAATAGGSPWPAPAAAKPQPPAPAASPPSSFAPATVRSRPPDLASSAEPREGAEPRSGAAPVVATPVPLHAAPFEPASGAVQGAPSPAAGMSSADAAAIATDDTAPRARGSDAPTALFPDGKTAAGGLLFLLRPLAALDLPGWIDRHPWAAASAFATRLLAGIARDHGAAGDDPLLAALTAVDAAADPALDRPRWRAAWERALARWLREAKLTLAAVVRRPAQLVSTRTHIDVCFSLRSADIAIRIAGLDIDPGWVPWLSRVVHFHYLDGEAP